MGKEVGRSLRDGLSPSVEPVPVSPAVLASIPNAGDIGIIDHGLLYDSHQIVRVVKGGPLHKMWLVQYWQRGFRSPGQWEREARRKVREWIPVSGSVDVDDLANRLRDVSEAKREHEKRVVAAYHVEVRALASAMSASGQDAQRLEAKPASAVPQADAQ